MPVYDLTIDDSSPVIRFGSAWNDATKAQDGGIVSYYNQTFHATTGQNAKAAFSFYGTTVSLYGSTWFNHGTYQVSVDGAVVTTENGYSADRVFQVKLASYALGLGNHDIVLSNAWTDTSTWLDLDFITFTTGDGNAQTSSQDITLDDTVKANFTFDSSWGDAGNSLSQYYYQQTFHSTNTLGGNLLVEFDGNAVALYGATSGNHGLYSVSLDGGSATTYNGTASAFRAGMLLYYASGLSYGSHTLSVTNLGSGADGYLDIDKLVVSRWEASSPQPSASGSSTPAPHHKSNVAAIAGGAAGGAVALLLAALAAFLLLRRRRRREMAPAAYGHKPDLGVADPTATLQPFPARAPPAHHHGAATQAPQPQVFDLPPPAYDEGPGSPRRAASVAGSTVAGSVVGAGSAAGSASARRPLPSPPMPGSAGVQSEKGARR